MGFSFWSSWLFFFLTIWHFMFIPKNMYLFICSFICLFICAYNHNSYCWTCYVHSSYHYHMNEYNPSIFFFLISTTHDIIIWAYIMIRFQKFLISKLFFLISIFLDFKWECTATCIYPWTHIIEIITWAYIMLRFHFFGF